jgi:WD40 repeat protein
LILNKGHTADIQCLQTIDNSKRLISGSCDTTIRIWNLSGKHECVKTVKEHTKYVNILKKVKTDRLISSANDNSIKVWDIRNFECVQTFKEHQKWVSHILMLQNGKVCSCSWDGSIKVW